MHQPMLIGALRIIATHHAAGNDDQKGNGDEQLIERVGKIKRELPAF